MQKKQPGKDLSLKEKKMETYSNHCYQSSKIFQHFLLVFIKLTFPSEFLPSPPFIQLRASGCSSIYQSLSAESLQNPSVLSFFFSKMCSFCSHPPPAPGELAQRDDHKSDKSDHLQKSIDKIPTKES